MNQEVGSHQTQNLLVPASRIVRNKFLVYKPPSLWCFITVTQTETDRDPNGISLPSFFAKSHQPLWSSPSFLFLSSQPPARFNCVNIFCIFSPTYPDTGCSESSDSGLMLKTSLSPHPHEEQFYLASRQQQPSNKPFASSYWIWDLRCPVTYFLFGMFSYQGR